MSREQKSNKESRKQPLLTKKEKRAAKRAKKESGTGSALDTTRQA